MKACYHLGALAAATTLLAGCAVYVPTVPSTPLLEARQVEATVGMRDFSSLEAGAAWSPVPHLLLTGEAALQGTTATTTTTNNITTSYRDYHQQAGLGVGLYRAATDRSPWYAAAVGGAGVAKVSLHSLDAGLFLLFPYSTGYYEATYWRYYGQVYAARPLSTWITGGFSVRGTYVNYTHFTFEGQAVEPNNHFFIEPTLFLRLGQGPLRGFATVGLSMPTGKEDTPELTKRTASVSGLFGLGVVVRPDLIRWHHKD